MRYLFAIFLLCTPALAQERPLCILRQPGQPASDAQHPPHGTRWQWARHDLTWHIDQYPEGLNPDDVDRVFNEAFANWAAVCNMQFTQVRQWDQAHIRMTFDFLGGPWGNLAEMYYPGVNWGANWPSDEYTHGTFNIDYPWDAHGLIALKATATHEIGHALGFFHRDSDVTSVMYPYGNGVNSPNEADASIARGMYGAPIAILPPGDPVDPPGPNLVPPKRPGVRSQPWTGRGNR